MDCFLFVHSMRNSLLAKRLNFNIDWFGFQVLLKVCFFNSILRRGVIMSIEYQRKRKVMYISWCFLCKSSSEDVDHLLLHCQVARGYGGNPVGLDYLELC